MKTGLATMFLALVAAGGPACAAHWNVEYAKSRLGFSVQWSNEAFSAAFQRWSADIDFDPADLAHADVSVMIDLASETSDEPDFDSGLKGAQGFQTTQFPAARFVATNFIRKSAESYEARGTLTIRGISRGVILPFSLAITGRTAHMTGTAHVLRSEFGVGQGTWSAPTPVSHDVTVTIDLTATQ
jgi:polyisoprenoid-binding protein YceI